MIKFEQFMEIQLLRQQGFSLRAIASQLHISRNTVRKYLQQRSLPTYLLRKAKLSLLAAHQASIQQRVQSALPHKLPATVIFREMRQVDWAQMCGGRSPIYAFLATFRVQSTAIGHLHSGYGLSNTRSLSSASF